jgi:hypothetical protein
MGAGEFRIGEDTIDLIGESLCAMRLFGGACRSKRKAVQVNE